MKGRVFQVLARAMCVYVCIYNNLYVALPLFNNLIHKVEICWLTWHMEIETLNIMLRFPSLAGMGSSVLRVIFPLVRSPDFRVNFTDEEKPKSSQNGFRFLSDFRESGQEKTQLVTL